MQSEILIKLINDTKEWCEEHHERTWYICNEIEDSSFVQDDEVEEWIVSCAKENPDPSTNHLFQPIPERVLGLLKKPAGDDLLALLDKMRKLMTRELVYNVVSHLNRAGKILVPEYNLHKTFRTREKAEDYAREKVRNLQEMLSYHHGKIVDVTDSLPKTEYISCENCFIDVVFVRVIENTVFMVIATELE